MKKSDFILIGVVLLVALVAVFSSKGNEQLEEIKFPLTLKGEAGLSQISYNEYEEKVNSGEAFVVIIERTGCSYCEKYMPIMEEYAKDMGYPIYYIDTAYLTENEYNKLSTKNSYLKKNNWGTPTTLFMLGNRVVGAIGGYEERESIEAFFDGKVAVGE